MFKGYDDILILSGAGFGIDAGLPDYDGVHAMVDEAAQRFIIQHIWSNIHNFIKIIQELLGV